MKVRFLLAVGALLGVAGCLDFEAAFRERLAVLADAGTSDAGPTDAGGQDAGEADAGADAGAADAGEPDAGQPDAGEPDAGEDAGVDAGVDAGPTCGPSRLVYVAHHVDDAGVRSYVAASASDTRVLVAGDLGNGEGHALLFPGNRALPVPSGENVVFGFGTTGDELFAATYQGDALLREDAGFQRVLGGPCAGWFAEAVASPAPGRGFFCDNGSLRLCEWNNGAVALFAPGVTRASIQSCLTIAAHGDEVIRAVSFHDGGTGLRDFKLLYLDGGMIDFPVGTQGLTALDFADPAQPFVVDYFGQVRRYVGGWQDIVSDGGSHTDVVTVGVNEAYLVGSAGQLSISDGTSLCPASIEGLPAGFPAQVGWQAIRATATGLVLTGRAGDPAGITQGLWLHLQRVPR